MPPSASRLQLFVVGALLSIFVVSVTAEDAGVMLDGARPTVTSATVHELVSIDRDDVVSVTFTDAVFTSAVSITVPQAPASASSVVALRFVRVHFVGGLLIDHTPNTPHAAVTCEDCRIERQLRLHGCAVAAGANVSMSNLTAALDVSDGLVAANSSISIDATVGSLPSMRFTDWRLGNGSVLTIRDVHTPAPRGTATLTMEDTVLAADSTVHLDSWNLTVSAIAKTQKGIVFDTVDFGRDAMFVVSRSSFDVSVAPSRYPNGVIASGANGQSIILSDVTFALGSTIVIANSTTFTVGTYDRERTDLDFFRISTKEGLFPAKVTFRVNVTTATGRVAFVGTTVGPATAAGLDQRQRGEFALNGDALLDLGGAAWIALQVTTAAHIKFSWQHITMGNISCALPGPHVITDSVLLNSTLSVQSDSADSQAPSTMVVVDSNRPQPVLLLQRTTLRFSTVTAIAGALRMHSVAAGAMDFVHLFGSTIEHGALRIDVGSAELVTWSPSNAGYGKFSSARVLFASSCTFVSGVVAISVGTVNVSNLEPVSRATYPLAMLLRTTALTGTRLLIAVANATMDRPTVLVPPAATAAPVVSVRLAAVSASETASRFAVHLHSPGVPRPTAKMAAPAYVTVAVEVEFVHFVEGCVHLRGELMAEHSSMTNVTLVLAHVAASRLLLLRQSTFDGTAGSIDVVAARCIKGAVGEATGPACIFFSEAAIGAGVTINVERSAFLVASHVGYAAAAVRFERTTFGADTAVVLRSNNLTAWTLPYSVTGYPTKYGTVALLDTAIKCESPNGTHFAVDASNRLAVNATGLHVGPVYAAHLSAHYFPKWAADHAGARTVTVNVSTSSEKVSDVPTGLHHTSSPPLDPATGDPLLLLPLSGSLSNDVDAFSGVLQRAWSNEGTSDVAFDVTDATARVVVHNVHMLPGSVAIMRREAFRASDCVLHRNVTVTVREAVDTYVSLSDATLEDFAVVRIVDGNLTLPTPTTAAVPKVRLTNVTLRRGASVAVVNSSLRASRAVISMNGGLIEGGAVLGVFNSTASCGGYTVPSNAGLSRYPEQLIYLAGVRRRAGSVVIVSGNVIRHGAIINAAGTAGSNSLAALVGLSAAAPGSQLVFSHNRYVAELDGGDGSELPEGSSISILTAATGLQLGSLLVVGNDFGRALSGGVVAGSCNVTALVAEGNRIGASWSFVSASSTEGPIDSLAVTGNTFVAAPAEFTLVRRDVADGLPDTAPASPRFFRVQCNTDIGADWPLATLQPSVCDAAVLRCGGPLPSSALGVRGGAAEAIPVHIPGQCPGPDSGYDSLWAPTAVAAMKTAWWGTPGIGMLAATQGLDTPRPLCAWVFDETSRQSNVDPTSRTTTRSRTPSLVRQRSPTMVTITSPFPPPPPPSSSSAAFEEHPTQTIGMQATSGDGGELVSPTVAEQDEAKRNTSATPSATATLRSAANTLPPLSAADTATENGDHLKRSAAHGVAKAVGAVAAGAIAVTSALGVGPATIASASRLQVLAGLTECPLDPSADDVDVVEFPFQPPIALTNDGGDGDGDSGEQQRRRRQLNGGVVVDTAMAMAASTVAVALFKTRTVAWFAERRAIRSFVAAANVLFPAYFAPIVWAAAAGSITAGLVDGGIAVVVYCVCLIGCLAAVASIAWAAWASPHYCERQRPTTVEEEMPFRNTSDAVPFVEVFGPIVDGSRAFPDPALVRFNAAAEVGASMGIAAASFIADCTARCATAAAVALAFLVYAVLLRPLAANVENGFLIANAAVQFIAAALMLTARLAMASAPDSTLGTLAVAYDAALLFSALLLFVMPITVAVLEVLQSRKRAAGPADQCEDGISAPLLLTLPSTPHQKQHAPGRVAAAERAPSSNAPSDHSNHHHAPHNPLADRA